MEKHELLEIIPFGQQDQVFNQDECDIDYQFLGFTDIYKYLSMIIPKHFTVVDFGCAYNAQSFYFTDHKVFIAVDVSDCKKFRANNCLVYQKTIESFISVHIGEFDLDETFAICSYIPPWGADNMKLVREAFKNVFTYYPHGGIEHMMGKRKD